MYISSALQRQQQHPQQSEEYLHRQSNQMKNMDETLPMNLPVSLNILQLQQ
jgi:hypothetical protein